MSELILWAVRNIRANLGMNKNLQSINKTIYTASGIKIFYNVAVPKKVKANLIFLHGMGGDLTAWKNIRNKLSEYSYSSVAIDLRGHGDSARPPHLDDYTIKNLAEDIKAVVAYEGMSESILIGHCLGGMVTLEVVNILPQKIKALILINTSYHPPHFAKVISGQPLFRELVGKLSAILPEFRNQTRPDYTKFINSGNFSISRVLSDMSHTSLKSYFRLVYHVLKFEGSALLFKIKIPTLILSGLSDSVFTPQDKRDLHTRIPGSIIKFIPGGNHVMVLSKVEEISREINQFIEILPQ